jgi:hypothetical protein
MTMQLSNSRVRRGGVTSNYWYGATDKIFAIAAGDGTVTFRFTLPSKGGGQTQIELVVGEGDLEQLLKEFAAQNPPSAKLFTACTAAAVKALLKTTHVK